MVLATLSRPFVAVGSLVVRGILAIAARFLSLVSKSLKFDKSVTFIIKLYGQIQSVFPWFRWLPTSAPERDVAEAKVLSYLKSPYRTYYVDVGSVGGLEDNKIWTLEMSPQTDTNDNQKQTQNTPIVLVHGFASGIGQWVFNLDSLYLTNRRIYAFDVLGFAKSSRPPVLHQSNTCEQDLIDSIERWRTNVGLNQKFILLGHSFGAYLSAAYALKYPERVAHLVMADPWGMPTMDMQKQLNQHKLERPWWVPIIAKIITSFTPLAGLRAAGPYGPTVVRRFRPDIREKFENVFGEGNGHHFLDYIYHCNARCPPTGEMCFQQLSTKLGWAKNPMIDRIGQLHNNIGLTFIFGSRSWIDRQSGFQTKYLLGDRVDVHVIRGAGHHVYADRYKEFNQTVTDVCDSVDSKEDISDNAVFVNDNDSADNEEVPLKAVKPLVD